MKNMNFAFFGTSRFAVRVLEELALANLIPTVVIATPDKPKGRGLLATPSPVKVWAQENNVEVLQPENLDGEFVAELKNTQWDLFVVAAYGKILPKELFELPRLKTLNVHPSLLPRLRGASPIQSAILTDEKKTGVTVMLINEKLDHGPVVAQASIEPKPWPPKASELEEVLAREGG
ncbi:MAG TPA: methionyl-tRNA formyltransferase, partial [Candidatus Paceibacterota bacterium]